MRRALPIIVVIATVLLSLPALALLGYQLLQYSVIRSRHVVTVPLRIEDTNGVALAGVQLRFKESGRRSLTPLPFARSWETKGSIHEVTSDASGLATVAFREDNLQLECVTVRGREWMHFLTVFHRHDGLNLTNVNSSRFLLRYEAYPLAKDPWRQNHSIIIE